MFIKNLQGIYMNKTVQVEYFIVFAQAARGHNSSGVVAEPISETPVP